MKRKKRCNTYNENVCRLRGTWERAQHSVISHVENARPETNWLQWETQQIKTFIKFSLKWRPKHTNVNVFYPLKTL